jgi:hypothetical protein
LPAVVVELTTQAVVVALVDTSAPYLESRRVGAVLQPNALNLLVGKRSP